MPRGGKAKGITRPAKKIKKSSRPKKSPPKGNVMMKGGMGMGDK